MSLLHDLWKRFVALFARLKSKANAADRPKANRGHEGVRPQTMTVVSIDDIIAQIKGDLDRGGVRAGSKLFIPNNYMVKVSKADWDYIYGATRERFKKTIFDAINQVVNGGADDNGLLYTLAGNGVLYVSLEYAQDLNQGESRVDKWCIPLQLDDVIYSTQTAGGKVHKAQHMANNAEVTQSTSVEGGHFQQQHGEEHYQGAVHADRHHGGAQPQNAYVPPKPGPMVEGSHIVDALEKHYKVVSGATVGMVLDDTSRNRPDIALPGSGTPIGDRYGTRWMSSVQLKLFRLSDGWHVQNLGYNDLVVRMSDGEMQTIPTDHAASLESGAQVFVCPRDHGQLPTMPAFTFFDDEKTVGDGRRKPRRP